MNERTPTIERKPPGLANAILKRLIFNVGHWGKYGICVHHNPEELLIFGLIPLTAESQEAKKPK